MAYAYHEKIARINLTTGTVTVEHLDPEVAKKIHRWSRFGYQNHL